MPVCDVLRDLIENYGSQVGFNCHKHDVWTTNHLYVGMSDSNAQLLKVEVEILLIPTCRNTVTQWSHSHKWEKNVLYLTRSNQTKAFDTVVLLFVKWTPAHDKFQPSFQFRKFLINKTKFKKQLTIIAHYLVIQLILLETDRKKKNVPETAQGSWRTVHSLWCLQAERFLQWKHRIRLWSPSLTT